MNLKAFFASKETKNASWMIGLRIVQMLLSFFVGILTARYLGPSNYGLLNYGTALATFFFSLCTLGLNSVIIKDFVAYPDENGKAIGSAILMRFVSSVLSALMMIGIAVVFDNNEPMTIAVVALCGLGAVFRIFETFRFWFQYQYMSKITSLATLVAYIITSVYKIVLLSLGKNIVWFAFSTSVDYIVAAIFLFIAYKKYNGPKLVFSKQKAKSLFCVSKHYIFSSLAVSIYGQTDKLMLKHMLGESEVGYYATATAICAMWTFVLEAIIDSLYPSILRLKQSDTIGYQRKNRQLYTIVFYVSSFVSLFFFFFGKFIINVFFGSEYLQATSVLRIITWYTAFSFLGVARNAWIVSEGHQKYLKYIYGCAAIINVILNLFFIRLWGGCGAAVASLITQIFTSIALPMFIRDLRPNAKLMLEAILLKDVFNKSNSQI